jgi:flavin reductase (DIM6/NTAB) family NADH-FMN oxidoreductase RutF
MAASTNPAAVEAAPAAVEQAFSGREFRDTVGAFATGVTVITTQGAEHPYGMTANAFSSVSLDPPLILVCVIKGTEGAENIEKNGVFAVNILRSDQEPISRYFASKDRPRGWEAFRQISHTRAASGSPILDDCAAYLDCRVAAIHDAGDHIIVIGEVMALGVDTECDPLLFHRGKYRYVTQE